MRNAACSAWCRLFPEAPFAFLTGDLGFMALEPLRNKMGHWFINAGVAEQNMVSVAAGMVKTGVRTWVYSIAPFAYARPFEQIRNDVCLNRLPVKIVGNGGGYGYGAMGPSHHAIEDYGVLLGLQGMHVFVPAFADDVEAAIRRMSNCNEPAYLRLGRCEKPDGYTAPTFQTWRRLTVGDGPLLVAVGPLTSSLWRQINTMQQPNRPELWVIGIMPDAWKILPKEIVDASRKGRVIALVEEHVAHGGAGQALITELVARGATPKHFKHFCAAGYPSGKYGSQSFHRRESGIDVESVLFRLLTEGIAR